MEALREIIFEDEMETEVNSCRDQQYQRSNMQRSAIMNRLRQAELQNREKSYLILSCRRNAPAVRKFIFWHQREILTSEWLRYTA